MTLENCDASLSGPSWTNAAVLVWMTKVKGASSQVTSVRALEDPWGAVTGVNRDEIDCFQYAHLIYNRRFFAIFWSFLLWTIQRWHFHSYLRALFFRSVSSFAHLWLLQFSKGNSEEDPRVQDTSLLRIKNQDAFLLGTPLVKHRLWARVWCLRKDGVAISFQL